MNLPKHLGTRDHGAPSPPDDSGAVNTEPAGEIPQPDSVWTVDWTEVIAQMHETECAPDARAASSALCVGEPRPAVENRSYEVMHRYLLAWRKFRGLSQERVASMLGVRHTTIGRWEKGTMRLSTEDLQSLSRVYGATVSQLQAQPEAAAMVGRLDKVQAIIEHMSEDDLNHWLAIGERLNRKN